MLVEKEKNFEGKIIAVKLLNGEEIIAQCVQDDQHGKARTIKVRQPVSLRIGPQQGPDSVTRVSFSPWMLSLSTEEVINLKSEHILVLAEAGENATNQYMSAVTPRT